MIKLYRNLPGKIKKNTYKQIEILFKKYGYRYDFKRDEIEEMFNVKKSRASEIIALLLDCNLIETSDPTKYRFKK